MLVVTGLRGRELDDGVEGDAEVWAFVLRLAHQISIEGAQDGLVSDDEDRGAQALEFDDNQSVGGSKYIFGTECDFRGSGTWRVWNAPGHTWAATNVGCAAPEPGTWHHLTWEFQRSGGQANFVAVTLDGVRHDVGMNFAAIGQGGSGLDVAFQADLTASGGNQSVWLDNVSLSW